jgi:ABC-type branched-subunit amino acid transport system ATPase component
MFTVLAQGRRVPRPSIAESNSAYYYVVLAFVLGAVLVIALIQRGRLGRILLGMAESPQAVATLGQSINTTRVIVFCIGAYLAAVAGALHGGMLGVAGAESTVFSSFNSIVLLAILALAPFQAPWFAIFAGLTQLIPAYIEGDHTGEWLTVLFGAAAIVIATQGGPMGMPDRLRSALDAQFRRPARTTVPPPVLATGQLRRPRPDAPRGGTGGLQLDGLTVRFGGLSAVEGVSLAAPMGRITGLIGPNGAGKTTTFNACSGLNKPSAGRVLLHGHDVSSQSPPARARRGLGRTFQIMELCESLTVAENVALGRESSQSGSGVLSQIAATPEQSRVRREATSEAMELCGIGALAGRQAGALSMGERRLVELARCLAGPFDTLLLDEPSSGLDHDETARFGEILTTVVDERGCGVLLVEHDMSLVMGVCSYLYVLDFGKLIFEGSPEQVASSEVVQTAYLGAQPVEPVGHGGSGVVDERGAQA